MLTSNSDLYLTIKSIPWFHDLPANICNQLIEIASYCDFPKGSYIFEEGNRSDIIYVVLEGQVALEAFIPTRGNKVVYYANPLDVIGWSSLTPVVRQRANSARAVNNCHLLAISAVRLIELCDSNPEFGYIVMKKLSNIIASTFLNTRLHLFEVILNQPSKRIPASNE